MTKAKKLRVCNWSLLVATLLILASGIQLEATGSRGEVAVWIHIYIGTIFSFLFSGILPLTLVGVTGLRNFRR